MKNYKVVKIYGYEVYIDAEKDTVHHAVRLGKTLYPYIWSAKQKNYCNCCGEYKKEYFRKKMKNGKVWFK